MELYELDLYEASKGIKDRKFSAQELFESCKKRIDSTIAECSIVHTYHRHARYEIEIANGSYAWLKICYKHKPVERVGVPEQMQLFKVEDYVCK